MSNQYQTPAPPSTLLGHLFNIYVHVLPLSLVLTWERAPLSAAHGAAAVAFHFGWGLLKSRGTLALDDVYVPLSRKGWYCLWSVAVATELGMGVLGSRGSAVQPKPKLGFWAGLMGSPSPEPELGFLAQILNF